MRQAPRPAAIRRAAALLLLLVWPILVAADDEEHEYPRIDPDNPGGERFGDDPDDDYSGYPVDPGEPDDPYYDTTAEHRPYSPNWTGAFVGGGAMGGVATFRAPYTEGVAVAPTFGVFAETSTVYHILTLQTAYRFASFRPNFDLGGEGTLTRHSITGSAVIHPLFLSLLGGDWISYTLGELRFYLGPSLDSIAAEVAEEREHMWTLGYHLGTGVDTYIDNPHDGTSWWIGFDYRYNVVTGSRDEGLFQRAKGREHAFMLRLSFRWNGNAIPMNDDPLYPGQ